jgi:hypothetical protein
MNKIIAAALAMLFMVTAALAAKDTPESYSQKILLKNWALSRCLSKAYPSEISKNDAEITAGAFLEFSKFSLDANEKAEALVDKFLAKKYDGSVKSNYNTMKCIDLFHSKELDDLARRYTK